MFNSRAKGARGEREVCDLLQCWWNQLEPASIFRRTPASGGWAYGEARGNFKTSGDIVTDALRWPFSCEVKFRNGWSERELAAGRRSPVWGWWAQCCRAAGEARLEPLLVFRKNHRPWLAMVRERWAEGPPRAKPWETYLEQERAVYAWGHDVVRHALPHPVVHRLEDLLSLVPALVALPPQPGLR